MLASELRDQLSEAINSGRDTPIEINFDPPFEPKLIFSDFKVVHHNDRLEIICLD